MGYLQSLFKRVFDGGNEEAVASSELLELFLGGSRIRSLS